eukprot:TRINITY_DN3253_c0_g1_i1.p1 TRINITY_DN3253_c0_g1~~TRINITY_DN3253_c0_g1_i1.p1  ORF type:complete len:144 (+),score=15.44 TRINITY_DN3253_c0_g1_i1:21-452(+)
MEGGGGADVKPLPRADGTYHYATTRTTLKANPLTRIHVRGRPILLTYSKGKVYALDARCYHMGGPLWQSDVVDVEDIGTVLVCPFHGYKITLSGGERVYTAMGGKLQIAGKRQRTHTIKVVFAQLWSLCDAIVCVEWGWVGCW